MSSKMKPFGEILIRNIIDMKRYTLYIYVLALGALALVGCEPSNEANAPQEGEVIELSFSMTSEMAEPLGMPARLVQDDPTLPGDPGKDDFIAPTHLYFVLWVQTTAGQKQMIAVKESSLSAAAMNHLQQS